MKKQIKAGIIIALGLLLSMSVVSLAQVSERAALQAAKKEIPKSCTLQKSEHDGEDGEWEFDFLTRNRKTEYEVTVNADTGAVRKVEMEQRGDRGGKKVKITVKKAKKAVKKLFGVIRITSAKKKKDDGRYIFRIRFTADGYTGEAEVNAATGKVIEWTKYYK